VPGDVCRPSAHSVRRRSLRARRYLPPFWPANVLGASAPRCALASVVCQLLVSLAARVLSSHGGCALSCLSPSQSTSPSSLLWKSRAWGLASAGSACSRMLRLSGRRGLEEPEYDSSTRSDTCEGEYDGGKVSTLSETSEPVALVAECVSRGQSVASLPQEAASFDTDISSGRPSSTDPVILII